MMRFFGYAHLPARLQAVSKPFHELAGYLNETLPDGEEKAFALRNLLQAKDCAVRAMLP